MMFCNWARRDCIIQKREGVVKEIVRQRPGFSELMVDINGEKARAVNYDSLTGPVFPGDCVVLNTTAVKLGLGTGGVHFVCFNYSLAGGELNGSGHIMKMRYTPYQLPVLSCEEEEAIGQGLNRYQHLSEKTPVIIGELHSMLAPAAIALKRIVPELRIGYIMTDTAALPLSFSRVVHALKQRNYIQHTVTSGQSFGGDLEAINVYTGLIALVQVLRVDVVIITPGPGVTGSNTTYGFSGIEVGENVNRVSSLGGTPLVIPRLTFKDQRQRHCGVSHHTLTALSVAAHRPALFPLPPMRSEEMKRVTRQLTAYDIFDKHLVCSVLLPQNLEPEILLQNEQEYIEFSSMGRDLAEDPLFFASPVAVAYLAGSRFFVRKLAGK